MIILLNINMNERMLATTKNKGIIYYYACNHRSCGKRITFKEIFRNISSKIIQKKYLEKSNMHNYNFILNPQFCLLNMQLKRLREENPNKSTHKEKEDFTY